MPDPFIDFLPVVAVDADVVRARFNADMTAGLAPTDPAFPDLTEGGFVWDATQPGVLEAVRLWEFVGTELPAASFPATSWGDYLDLHGETINLPRDGAVQASGTVGFTGPVGTLIAAGTQVATVQADPSSDAAPVSFTTDRSITLVASPGPTNLVLTPHAAGGTLPAGLYYYVVTTIGPNGETIASNEQSVTLAGATSSVDLAWTAVAGATGYKVYRAATPGDERLIDTLGAVTAFTDNGSFAPGAAIAPTNTVPVTAIAAGSLGNVAAGTITQVLSPIAGAPAVTNPSATSGGADVESDQRYQQRILAFYGQATGAGNASDYVRWALAFSGQIGFATVQPLWNGNGTVRVIITDPENHPNSASVVTGLQDHLDPTPGQGAGQAPIGAIVTVATPTVDAIAVSLHPSFDAGYSLDGAGGTVALRQPITDAVAAYVNTLVPGAEVILNAVVSQVMQVPGLFDVSNVLLNGAAANVVVPALEVAELTVPVTFT